MYYGYIYTQAISLTTPIFQIPTWLSHQRQSTTWLTISWNLLLTHRCLATRCQPIRFCQQVLEEFQRLRRASVSEFKLIQAMWLAYCHKNCKYWSFSQSIKAHCLNKHLTLLVELPACFFNNRSPGFYLSYPTILTLPDKV